MAFKPKSVRPSSQELLETVGHVAAQIGQLPTAKDLPLAATREGEGAPATRRSTGPTVLVNFKATLPFAKLIAEASEKEGGVRRMIARMMKEAGYDVPDRDLKPVVNRRIYE